MKCYKQLLRRKRRAWQKTAQQDLCDLASRNPHSFWRAYNRRKQQKSGIPPDQWKSSFDTLYVSRDTASSASDANDPVNPPQSPNPSFPSDGCLATGPAFDLLNADITQDEVEAALKRLKGNKAAGVDGIRAEFILDAVDMLLGPLVQTFNQVLNDGVPPTWCTGLIHPIFKAGDPDGNYRGITVVVILAKLYAMVLESRASSWAECEM